MGVLLNNIVIINSYFAPSVVEKIMLIKNRNSKCLLATLRKGKLVCRPEIESKSKVMSGAKTLGLQSPQ